MHLLKLPPHLTHLLQPLDLSVFKPMKSAWDLAVADFMRKERRAITRRDFPSLLKIAWEKGFKPQNAVGGFRRAGISPYNHTVVPQSALHYSEPFHQSSYSHTVSPVSEPSAQQEDDSNREGESLVSQLCPSADQETIASHPQDNAPTITHTILQVSQTKKQFQVSTNSMLQS